MTTLWINRTLTDRHCGKRPSRRAQHPGGFLSKEDLAVRWEVWLGADWVQYELQFSWEKVWTGKKHLQITCCLYS